MTYQRFEDLPVWQEEEEVKRAKSLQQDLLRRLPPTHPLRRDAEARGLI